MGIDRHANENLNAEQTGSDGLGFAGDADNMGG